MVAANRAVRAEKVRFKNDIRRVIIRLKEDPSD